MISRLSKTIKSVILNPSGFFLKNLGTQQTIAKNTFWLSFSTILSKIFKYFLIIYVARIVGATEYGIFNFAMSFVALFSILSDLGIASLISREVAKEEKSEIHISSAFTLKLLLTLITLILIIIVSFSVPQAPETKLTILILAGYILINNLSVFFYNCFYGKQEMQYQSIAEVISVSLTAALGIYLITLVARAYILAIAYLVGAIVGLCIIGIIFRKRFGAILKLDFNKKEWRKILNWSWPLALGSLFALIYTNTDSLMMGFWHLFNQIGYYNAAQKIIGASIIPASLITTSFFPALAKAHSNQEKQKMQKLFDSQNVVLLMIAIPIVVGGYLLANGLILRIYGKEYQPAILAFRILILMGGFSYLMASLSRALFIYNQQKRTFLITALGAILNVVLNFILIPKYGFYGAAWASVVTFFLNFILLSYYTQKLTPLKIINRRLIKYLFIFLLSSIIMGLVLLFLAAHNANPFFKIGIGALVYFACLLVFGGFVFRDKLG